jgi:hypothetical protein
MSKYNLRKQAYRYIQERLGKLPVGCSGPDQGLCISLDELAQLKAGIADPSAMLVATFKQLFRGTIAEAEVDIRLVKPFLEDD